jgi:hypothetical protein
LTKEIIDDLTRDVEQAIPKIPKIPEEDLTPLVAELLEIINLQQKQIQELKDEIARFKGHKTKPKLKPSALGQGSKIPKGQGKRPGSSKRRKKLEIHRTVKVPPENVPEGSRFKGYQRYTVQDLILQPCNTVYLLERYETPDGQHIVGQVPKEAGTGHFGTTLECFILYQYYHAHVTDPARDLTPLSPLPDAHWMQIEFQINDLCMLHVSQRHLPLFGACTTA